jgi:hypothetical protein
MGQRWADRDCPVTLQGELKKRKKGMRSNMRAGKVDQMWGSGHKAWVQQYAADVVGVVVCEEGHTFSPAVLQSLQNQVRLAQLFPACCSFVVASAAAADSDALHVSVNLFNWHRLFSGGWSSETTTGPVKANGTGCAR